MRLGEAVAIFETQDRRLGERAVDHLELGLAGRRLAVRPEYDAAVTGDVRRFFDDYATVAFANYGAEPVA